MPELGPFTLQSLPYADSALEPIIAEGAIRMHHDVVHAAYVQGLNDVLRTFPELQGKTIEQLLSHVADAPEAARPRLREQGGGHANHQLYWKVMAAPNRTRAPGGTLGAQIDTDFGSFEAFKERFERSGAAHIGPGWVVLVTDPDVARLEIMTFSNQESALEVGRPALLLNDLWEHAYRSRENDRKLDYLRAWWPLVDWPYIEKRFEAIRYGHVETLGGQQK